MHQNNTTRVEIFRIKKMDNIMHKILLLVFLLTYSYSSFAQMPEAECYKLQTETYNHADDRPVNKKNHLDLSIKLTEECGYLMTEEVLKQRREYNYLLYKLLNNQQ